VTTQSKITIFFITFFVGIGLVVNVLVKEIQQVHAILSKNQWSLTDISFSPEKVAVILRTKIVSKPLNNFFPYLEKLSFHFFSLPLELEINHHFGIDGYDAEVIIAKEKNQALSEYEMGEVKLELVKQGKFIEVKFDEIKLKSPTESLIVNSVSVFFQDMKFKNLWANVISYEDLDTDLKIRGVSVVETSNPNNYQMTIKRFRSGIIWIENIAGRLAVDTEKNTSSYLLSGTYKHSPFKLLITDENKNFYGKGMIPKNLIEDHISPSFEEKWSRGLAKLKKSDKLKSLQYRMSKDANLNHFKKETLYRYIPSRYFKENEHYYQFEIPKDNRLHSTALIHDINIVLREWEKLPFDQRIETAFFQCSISYRNPVFCRAARKMLMKMDKETKEHALVKALEARTFLSRVLISLTDDEPALHPKGLELAENAIEELKALDPQSKYLKILRYEIYKDQGNTLLADRELLAFIDQETNQQLNLYYNTLLSPKNRVKNVQEIAEQATKIDPTSYIAQNLMYLKAMELKRSKQFEAYENEIKRIITTTNPHPWLFLNYANYLLNNERKVEALNVLKDCLASSNSKSCLSEYETKQYLMIQKKVEQKKYDMVLKDFDTMISINPLNSKAYHGRGIILESMQRFAEALNSFLTACGLNIADACIRAGKWNEKNSPQEAAPFFEIACSLKNDNECKKVFRLNK
jgi:hypothetical protein